MMADWTFPHCPQPGDVVDWDSLLNQFGCLRTLADCPQNPEYHGEGNVLTHTRMVVDVLIHAKHWPNDDPHTRSVLFAAALLHDIAKPVCTYQQAGRIVAPGHAAKGARLTQSLLYQDWPFDTPVPFAIRQQIVGLVRYHGLPLWFWDRPDMRRAVVTASRRVRCDRLAEIARADVLGRICPDQADLLDHIDLFEEYCAENACLSSPRAFPTDHSRFRYFHHHTDAALDVAMYDDTRFEVVLMAGLPGAGKDTWIGQNLGDWPVISLDRLRQQMKVDPADDQGAVIAAARDQARAYLRQETSFVWNATNVSHRLREGLVRLFDSYQARVRIVYLEVPWPTLLQRNQSRPESVPEPVLHKLGARLEVPDSTEAHRVNWITG
jgi:predicted kinase